MERIVLGKTGLEISRFGFGGIPIQRADEEEAVRTVAHAIEKGVDFIDTSRAYTTSEDRIGKALRLTGAKVVLASKSQSRTADGLRKDLETSLQNLGVDSIDLYQCHFVKDEADYQRICSPGGALEGVLKAKAEGLIRHIGITSHSLTLLEKVLDDDIFETIMACFSFLEPAAKDTVIPKALAKNVGMIAMKSFSGGVIENADLALRYVLSHPGIVIIPGVESVELFDRNWAVYQNPSPLTDKDWQEIEKIRTQHEKTFCRRCDYCQPCSEKIPIQLVLGLPSALRRFGRGFLEKDWAIQAISNARNCTECGECMSRCPYELPIPELIRKNLKWLDEQNV